MENYEENGTNYDDNSNKRENQKNGLIEPITDSAEAFDWGVTAVDIF